MKQVILTMGLAMLLLASCKKDAPVAPEVPPTPPPVENPAPPSPPKPQVQVPPPPPPTVAPEEKDGTSVSLDENGVNVSSKNGAKDSKVIISKNKKEVKFSTN
ncbi:hypothetical protein [Flavobacterium rivuli]|uniref:hypothetical protein n=1 Tax=Flavobacterium rivuli TaxID=498301 RepID=UPI0003779D23|nr:hypothetical protein [Flavobacterium rivuli]